MAPRVDRFSIRRQAALLGLTVAAGKKIPTLIRHFVSKKIEHDTARFGSLAQQDIMSFAKAFVASHCEWLQQNRQDWRAADGARHSEEREEDIAAISRMIELQSRWQKKKRDQASKSSLDAQNRSILQNDARDVAGLAISASAVDQARSSSVERRARTLHHGRRRESSHSSYDTSVWAICTSEEETSVFSDEWTNGNDDRGRQREHPRKRRAVASQKSKTITRDTADYAAEQGSAVYGTINASSFVAPRGPDKPPDLKTVLYQSLDGIDPPGHVHAAVQTSSEAYEYSGADAAAQTVSVYANAFTQSNYVCTRDAAAQTTSKCFTDQETQTGDDERPQSRISDIIACDEQTTITDIGYFEVLGRLGSWRKQADVLAKQRSSAINQAQRKQLKEAKDGVDFVVRLFSQLAEGQIAILKIRADHDSE